MQLGKRNLYKGIKNIYIADIHSDGEKLNSLIKNLEKECSIEDYRVIFLGDLFGKVGMNSIKVIDVLKKLNKITEVLIIRGNWESYIIPELKDMKGCDILLKDHMESLSGFGFLEEFIKIGLKTGDDLFHYLEVKNFFKLFNNFIPYFETKHILATHAPICSKLFYNYYNKFESNKGILEKFPFLALEENFVNEDKNKIKINKTFICGHQTGQLIGPWGNQILIERKKPSTFNNFIYLDSGGAGTGKDIPIFAWIEDKNKFISS